MLIRSLYEGNLGDQFLRISGCVAVSAAVLRYL